MKFIFTTLAIGSKYFNAAKQFSIDLYNQNIDFYRTIISDIQDDNIPNTKVYPVPNKTVFSVCNAFNYNLKYLALQETINNTNIPYEYLIYIDADWRVRPEYDNNKIIKFLNSYNNNIDIFFERPHFIGASKNNLSTCFWKHKIEPYKLMNIDKYDKAHVPNEQFLIFKNNNKLINFINAWSLRNTFCIDNSIWTFAEGVEIGMSYIDAGMNAQWTNFGSINNCFEFNDVCGNLHIRF